MKNINKSSKPISTQTPTRKESLYYTPTLRDKLLKFKSRDSSSIFPRSNP